MWGLKCPFDTSLPEEVPENGFDNVPTDEDPEIVGRDICHTDGGRKLTDKTDAANHEARERETLGTGRSLQGFCWDDTLEGGVGEREDDVEEVVESKSCLTLGFANVSCVGNLLQNSSVDRQEDGAGLFLLASDGHYRERSAARNSPKVP